MSFSAASNNKDKQKEKDQLPNLKRDYSQQPTPITADGERPQKRFYRQRAHCNPLAHNDSYEYPVHPSKMQWTNAITATTATSSADAEATTAAATQPDNNNSNSNDWFYPPHQSPPTVLDIGCGFGGLTMALAQQLPHETVLGMEIRAKVTEYVRLRIVAARREQRTHHNAAVLRTNSMKYLPNYFAPASIRKVFVCFPDPHFKRKNHPRRIISVRLLSEYAHVLKPMEGRLYMITDVLELHEWHVRHCDAHPLFRRVVVSTEKNNNKNGNSNNTNVNVEDDDPCIQTMTTATEEGQKVERNGGHKYYAVYERVANDEAPTVDASNFFAAAN